MQRNQPDQEEHRFIYLNTWATDGIRVFRYYVDTTRKPTKTVSSRARLKVADIENKISDINKEADPGGFSQHFGAIVGIDPGHVFPAAAFSLPTDPTKPGVQFKVSNNYLYGRQGQAAKWLEERKVIYGIAYLEEELANNPKNGASLATILKNIRVWQRDRRLEDIPKFYNSPAVAHRHWDSKMSAASALDKTCELLERLAGDQQQQQQQQQQRQKKHEHAKPKLPTLFVIGDAAFANTRKGLQSSKHTKLISRLVQRLRKRYPSSVCVGIDEYKTSQICPRCLEKFKYMRRKPRGFGELKRKTKDKDGLVEDYRVQFCERYVPFYML